MNISEQISDDMSLLRRRKVLQELARELPTEALEVILAQAPKALEVAFHEILNPEVAS